MYSLTNILQDLSPKRLLCIFPHPDDESFATGALLLQAKKLGLETAVLSLTKGEYGKSHIAKGDKLAEAREKEFKAATSLLKVDKAKALELKDGFLKDDPAKLEAVIRKYLDGYQPGMVVTYDHGGFTGHPDHIAVSVAAMKVCREFNIPLLFYTPTGLTLKAVKHQTTKYNSKPQYIVKSFFNITKAKAFFSHKSQRHQKSALQNVLRYLFLLFASETYHLVDFRQKYRYKFQPFDLD